MAKVIFIIILILVIVTTIGKKLKNNTINHTVSSYKAVKNITPSEAKKLLDEKDDILLLDVRTKREYKLEHIKDSLLIPLSSLGEKIEAKVPAKTSTIIVYCRSGNRSSTAATKLVEMGYSNVYDLGGIINWPYETER